MKASPSGAVICGIDEAGLRSLARPVVACAAILPLAGISIRLLGALDDSKRLSAELRGRQPLHRDR